MKTLSQKLALGQRRFVKAVPHLVRSMANDYARFVKTEVWRDQGKDIQPVSVSGGRWKKRKRTKKNAGKPLLVDTGRLRRSITANARGNVGIIETRVPYGRYHNTGTSKLPQRKFLGESDIMNKRYEKKILKTINKALEG